MGVRVRVRLEVGDRAMEVPALLNSGFESDEPDVVIPVEVAEALGLWPPSGFRLEEVSTAGGDVRVFTFPGRGRVRLLLGTDYEPEITCNILVNPHVDEVLLSDYVIDELGIVVLSFRRGLWRHKGDPEDMVRESEPYGPISAREEEKNPP